MEISIPLISIGAASDKYTGTTIAAIPTPSYTFQLISKSYTNVDLIIKDNEKLDNLEKYLDSLKPPPNKEDLSTKLQNNVRRIRDQRNDNLARIVELQREGKASKAGKIESPEQAVSRSTKETILAMIQKENEGLKNVSAIVDKIKADCKERSDLEDIKKALDTEIKKISGHAGPQSVLRNAMSKILKGITNK